MVKKVVLAVVAVIVLVVGGLAVFLFTKSPDQRPAPDLKVEITPERLARGKYLAEHVAHCNLCHSTMDAGKFGLPPVAGTVGGGGMCMWTEELGFPGHLCASNITPHPEHGLGSWTDGEIIRAIREGVNKDGEALFPIMPYKYFASMSDEDAQAIVAWIRSLEPLPTAVPKRKLNPPLNIIVNFQPQPLSGPVAAPNKADPVKYGEYLVAMGGCKECHTPVDDKHVLLPGKDFSGGQVFKLPFTSVTSANITPHATGIKDWSKEMFLANFRTYSVPGGDSIAIDPKQNTVMPWVYFAGMTDEDLGAIYDYLRTVPPLENTVPKLARAVPAPQPVADVPTEDAPEGTEDEAAEE